MKKLLIIPMLFACFMGMGQAAVSSSQQQKEIELMKAFNRSKKLLNAKIGDYILGGKVFYVKDGHGLIAEVQDQSRSCKWKDAQKIISDPNNHSVKGKNHTDWRLPTKDELNLLYLQKNVVGGFANFNYWSSTEYDYNYAWLQDFFNGSQLSNDKNDTSYVRAIRSF